MIQKGTKVTILRMPSDLEKMPRETRNLFAACVGKTFPVAGLGRYGLLEIQVSKEITGAFTGRTDTVWIEAECVEMCK
jgi:hypothetical protein